jgi:hypothetical protein
MGWPEMLGQGQRSLAAAARLLQNRWMAAAASVPTLVELVAGANLLPTALVRALETAARVRDVVAGTVLLRQRAVVDDLVVLVTGRIAILVDFTGTGDLVVETTEQRGRIFGWSGVCEPGRASATVRADADSQVVMLPLDPVRHGPPRWTAMLCAVVAAGLADRTWELQQRWSGIVDAGDDA